MGPLVNMALTTESPPEWVDRLYPYNGRQPLYPHVHPAHRITDAERLLHKTAFKAKQTLHDDILPGGREPTYLQFPQVALGNWYERCCNEVPGFHKSMVRISANNVLHD